MTCSRFRPAVVAGFAALALALPIFTREAAAENVGSFTSATIELLSLTNPISLDIDPNNAPQDATAFSIPLGAIAAITIKGTAAADGYVHLTLMDDDLDENLRGGDDELEDRSTQAPVPKGGMFVITLYCDCQTAFEDYVVTSGLSSGEQSAEIYVRDGDKRIPADLNQPGGGKKRSWWKIDCDKETSQSMTTSGGSMVAPWGDTLVIPPGALATATTVSMANMFPLADVEAVPTGVMPISEAQTIRPDGLALLTPVTLTFRYTQEEAGELADERTLRVFRYDAALAQWLLVPGASVDPVNNLLSAPIQNFGTYGFAARTPAVVPALSPLGFAVAVIAILLSSLLMIRRRQRSSSGSTHARV